MHAPMITRAYWPPCAFEMLSYLCYRHLEAVSLTFFSQPVLPDALDFNSALIDRVRKMVDVDQMIGIQGADVLGDLGQHGEEFEGGLIAEAVSIEPGMLPYTLNELPDLRFAALREAEIIPNMVRRMN